MIPAVRAVRATTRCPTRDELRAASGGYVVRGSRTKADVRVVDVDGVEVVVKDFAAKPWWIRGFGRLQIARECRAYERLVGVEGIPRFIGRVDAHAFAVERVDACQLAFAPDRFRDGARHVERLVAVVERLHAAGVAHLDLRGRENVLVRPDGELVLLDFGSAVCLRPGSPVHRVAFGWLAAPDRSAVIKWKLLLAPDLVTSDERAFLARFRRLRALWPFNPKRLKRGLRREPVDGTVGRSAS